MKKGGKNIADRGNSLCKCTAMGGNMAYLRSDWKTDSKRDRLKEKPGWSAGARSCRP